MSITPKCSDCGHSAAEHREGRSACRHIIQTRWDKADRAKPPHDGAVWGGYGWECGCKKRRSEIEATLGPVCEHCNGTGRK